MCGVCIYLCVKWKIAKGYDVGTRQQEPGRLSGEIRGHFSPVGEFL